MDQETMNRALAGLHELGLTSIFGDEIGLDYQVEV